MLSRIISISLFTLAAATACTPPPSEEPPTIDAAGIMHYTKWYVSQNVVCDGHPVMLEADHTQMTLSGVCRMVTLSGSHNDVTVDMAAGGQFDITGSHNDVNWHQTEPGPPPVMINHGSSNTFHPTPRQE